MTPSDYVCKYMLSCLDRSALDLVYHNCHMRYVFQRKCRSPFFVPYLSFPMWTKRWIYYIYHRTFCWHMKLSAAHLHPHIQHVGAGHRADDYRPAHCRKCSGRIGNNDFGCRSDGGFFHQFRRVAKRSLYARAAGGRAGFAHHKLRRRPRTTQFCLAGTGQQHGAGRGQSRGKSNRRRTGTNCAGCLLRPEYQRFFGDNPSADRL